ncbi:hypothetical protein [Ktedonobacter racemifer]|uniref:Uncharacterized protein n=1 Tax=Ktedonobacter racemifer DSM 44963 TaxID=485913 RepID=D6TXH6_KTERA|nr:hypothetical protein [Ktedonobacter racemifer]EFH84909.1 hypothetical protein Krac_6028 [Ktedonobacter racemifer DSM 44963]
MTNIPIHWGVEVSADQKAYFAELLHKLAVIIDPGDSLREVRIIADNVLPLEVQLWVGKPYQPGPHLPTGVAVPVEQGNAVASKVFIRKVFFGRSETLEGQLEQLSTLFEELYHCRLYHQTWRRRGYINSRSTDPYSRDLFAVSGQVHDEYAVARQKNIFFGERISLHDEQGQAIPFFY